MKQFITVMSLGLSLVVSVGVASAQQDGSVINADGNSGASNAGVNPAVDADGPTIVYGDLNPGPGDTVIGPPATGAVPMSVPGTTGGITATDGDAATVGPGDASAAPGTVTSGDTSGMSLLGPDGTYRVTENTPSTVTSGNEGAVAPAPEFVPEAAPVATDTVEPVVTDSAIATATDLDGDNYADALELEIGLDPGTPDTDGDGVADGDEVNIYGTDPFVWDSDGDGLSDGDELFNVRTDPLVWDTDSGAVADTGDQVAADSLVATETATDATGLDSDSDRLADADEAAVGTDPNTPDGDGDGYYDGDEVVLGTDPFDPASFPTA